MESGLLVGFNTLFETRRVIAMTNDDFAISIDEWRGEWWFRHFNYIPNIVSVPMFKCSPSCLCSSLIVICDKFCELIVIL
mmetsp:Transcript_18044/g.35996  ORF Transcript_18044/g.35996 Transcript_18044/m.35996 type:complete len:80 (+) Transcript_18044:299-538(+)